MVVLMLLLIFVPVAFTFYWIGRGVRLNNKIKYAPDEVLIDLETGEVLESGTRAYDDAVNSGGVKFQ